MTMDLTIPYSELPNRRGEGGGRKPNCGLSIIECLNQFAFDNLTEKDIRKISRDKSAPWTRRAAAERALRTMEFGDIADFEPMLDGQMSARELRAQGINTEAIKKCKTKRRKLDNGTEEVEREIELHDRAGNDFDRVMDRTHGKPNQTLHVETTGIPPIVMIVSPMTKTRDNSQLGENPAQLEAITGIAGGDDDHSTA